jgi:hypothetical protein
MFGLVAVDAAVAGERRSSQNNERQSDRRNERPSEQARPPTADRSNSESGKSEASKSDSGKSESNKSSEKSESVSDGASDKSDSKGSSGASDTKSGESKSAAKADGEAGSTSEKGQKAQAGGQDQPDSARPPDTVVEWFQRMAKPTTPSTGGPANHPKLATDKPASPAPKPKGAVSSVRDRPLAVEFAKPEILAPGLSQKSLERAVSLGFTANGKVALSGVSAGVTRLLAPPGMTAIDAQVLLKQALPDQGLEVNQTYQIYRVATGADAELDLSAPAAAMATPCGTDRCFGSNIIGWRPQLQACTKSLRIGVVDTGIDQGHPAFSRRRIEPRPAAKTGTGLAAPVAANWHGTGVLALLAGEPQSGTPGLISDASFYVTDVFFPDANGLPVSDTASLLEALDWLAKKKVNIINMSLTGPHDALLKSAIESLSRKGILFVAAVGNDGPTAAPTFPSAYEDVVAVTAINKDLSGYRHANRGDHVDLAAPGVSIWTAMPGGKGAYHSGTSFAVPYATAVLASIYNSLPTKSKAEALKHLSFVDLGAPGRDPIYGRGLVIAPYACPALPERPTPERERPTPAVGTANDTVASAKP